MTDAKAPLALTMGDPAGLGPQLTLAAWKRLRRDPGRTFFAIASIGLLRKISPDCPLAPIQHPFEAASAFSDALPVLDIPLDVDRVIPGHPHASYARSVIESIETAVTLARSKTASGIVTNPIHKSSLQDQGFAFPGHTEYLAHLCDPVDQRHRSVMMLVIPGLRVVPLTIHMAHKNVAGALSTKLIISRAKIVASALEGDFGLKSPKLAVAALNPHGGESGKFGDEEQTIIAPAVAALKNEGLSVEGPFPADTLFAEHMRSRFDGLLCMYHDQALIPLKALNFHQGVNVTLGLPIIRTSPDHGTGFDIAGQNTANPASLIEAINLASQLAEKRTGISR